MNKASSLDRTARPIKIATGAVTLEGDLAIPEAPAESSCSPTAVAAAGRARGTASWPRPWLTAGWRRFCSTCSLKRKSIKSG